MHLFPDATRKLPARIASALLFAGAAAAAGALPDAAALGAASVPAGFRPAQVPAPGTEPDYNSPDLCKRLGGQAQAAGGSPDRICSDLDHNDTFCIVASPDALPCKGLFRHVIQCNRLNRPALDAFHCAASCKNKKARGARCETVPDPAQAVPVRATAVFAAEGFRGAAHTVTAAASHTLAFGRRESQAGHTLNAVSSPTESKWEIELTRPLGKTPLTVSLVGLVSCGRCYPISVSIAAVFKPVLAPLQNAPRAATVGLPIGEISLVGPDAASLGFSNPVFVDGDPDDGFTVAADGSITGVPQVAGPQAVPAFWTADGMLGSLALRAGLHAKVNPSAAEWPAQNILAAFFSDFFRPPSFSRSPFRHSLRHPVGYPGGKFSITLVDGGAAEIFAVENPRNAAARLVGGTAPERTGGFTVHLEYDHDDFTVPATTQVAAWLVRGISLVARDVKIHVAVPEDRDPGETHRIELVAPAVSLSGIAAADAALDGWLEVRRAPNGDAVFSVARRFGAGERFGAVVTLAHHYDGAPPIRALLTVSLEAFRRPAISLNLHPGDHRARGAHLGDWVATMDAVAGDDYYGELVWTDPGPCVLVNCDLALEFSAKYEVNPLRRMTLARAVQSEEYEALFFFDRADRRKLSRVDRGAGPGYVRRNFGETRGGPFRLLADSRIGLEHDGGYYLGVSRPARTVEDFVLYSNNPANPVPLSRRRLSFYGGWRLSVQADFRPLVPYQNAVRDFEARVAPGSDWSVPLRPLDSVPKAWRATLRIPAAATVFGFSEISESSAGGVKPVVVTRPFTVTLQLRRDFEILHGRTLALSENGREIRPKIPLAAGAEISFRFTLQAEQAGYSTRWFAPEFRISALALPLLVSRSYAESASGEIFSYRDHPRIPDSFFTVAAGTSPLLTVSDDGVVSAVETLGLGAYTLFAEARSANPDSDFSDGYRGTARLEFRAVVSEDAARRGLRFRPGPADANAKCETLGPAGGGGGGWRLPSLAEAAGLLRDTEASHMLALTNIDAPGFSRDLGRGLDAAFRFPLPALAESAGSLPENVRALRTGSVARRGGAFVQMAALLDWRADFLWPPTYFRNFDGSADADEFVAGFVWAAAAAADAPRYCVRPDDPESYRPPADAAAACWNPDCAEKIKLPPGDSPAATLTVFAWRHAPDGTTATATAESGFGLAAAVKSGPFRLETLGTFHGGARTVIVSALESYSAATNSFGILEAVPQIGIPARLQLESSQAQISIRRGLEYRVVDDPRALCEEALGADWRLPGFTEAVGLLYDEERPGGGVVGMRAAGRRAAVNGLLRDGPITIPLYVPPDGEVGERVIFPPEYATSGMRTGPLHLDGRWFSIRPTVNFVSRSGFDADLPPLYCVRPASADYARPPDPAALCTAAEKPKPKMNFPCDPAGGALRLGSRKAGAAATVALVASEYSGYVVTLTTDAGKRLGSAFYIMREDADYAARQTIMAQLFSQFGGGANQPNYAVRTVGPSDGIVRMVEVRLTRDLGDHENKIVVVQAWTAVGATAQITIRVPPPGSALFFQRDGRFGPERFESGRSGPGRFESGPSGSGRRDGISGPERAGHHGDINPAAEFPADVFQGSGAAEAGPPVQGDRAAVFGVANHRGHLAESQPFGFGDEFAQQGAADAPPLEFPPDIN